MSNERALDEIGDKIAAYRATDDQIKVLQDLKSTLRADIETALGDAEVGTVAGEPVITYKFGKRNALDQRALKRAHPEIWASFVAPSETRTFRVVES